MLIYYKYCMTIHDHLSYVIIVGYDAWPIITGAKLP